MAFSEKLLLQSLGHMESLLRTYFLLTKGEGRMVILKELHEYVLVLAEKIEQKLGELK